MTYCSLQELYLHSNGQRRTAVSLQQDHHYNVLLGLHFHSKSMHIKKGVCARERGLMGTFWHLWNKLKDRKQWSKGHFSEDVWGGVGCLEISLWWGVIVLPSFFFFLVSKRERGWGGEGGSCSAALLGARLATAVSYSIFWSPCKSRSLVEPAVVSEWKTSKATALGQAVAVCLQWVLVCSVFLW